jgi:hypothetical protein
MRWGVFAEGPVEGFDLTLVEVKRSNGRILDPVPGVYNAVNCQGDNRAERLHPEWLALSREGRATRRLLRRDAAWVCPTHPGYRKGLLDLVEGVAEAGPGVVLESLGFPDEGYCTCGRCRREWKRSGLPWEGWKGRVVADFVGEASRFLAGKELALALHPDPIAPEAYGYDFEALSEWVDFFIAPLYARSYSTAYWVDLLAKGFRRRLEKPLYVALYARVPERELLKATLTASPYAEGILFHGDVETARRVVEGLRA